MKDETKFHQDIILVTDKILAATLCALSHEIHNIFEYRGGKGHNSFYALFKITKRLREDLKRYYRPGLAVNVKMVGEQLDEIEMALADYISLIEYEYSKRKEAFS
jgi:methylaspartate ammonia-lyase